MHSSLRVIEDPSLGSVFERYWLAFSYLVDGFVHRKLGINPHPRMLIALSGLDGSGKTKHARVLQKAFRTCTGVEARYVWSRAGSLPLTNVVLRILRKLKIDYRRDRRHLQSANEWKPPREKATLALWSMLNALDLILFFFFKVTIPLVFGKVVIADRFIDDSLVDLERLRQTPDFDRRIYKWIRWLAPKPDVWLFLNVKPDEILRRGGDETGDELAVRHRLYQLVRSGSQARILDNSRPFEKASGQLVQTSLEAFFRKYPQKYRNYRLLSFRY